MSGIIPDIIVTSEKHRFVDQGGAVLRSFHKGISAKMQNGEKIFLKSEQFEYITERSVPKEKKSV